MEKRLNEMIEQFRRGDESQFLLISDKFSMLSQKYAKILYKNESEDVISEMNLALLEAIHKIEYTASEGQCVVFINTALKNKFLELYRKSRKKYDNEACIENNQDFCGNFDPYKDVEFRKDLDFFLESYSEKQRNILLSLIVEGKSNTAVAIEHHVSRQYTNRIKNKLYQELKTLYY